MAEGAETVNRPQSGTMILKSKTTPSEGGLGVLKDPQLFIVLYLLRGSGEFSTNIERVGVPL